MYINLLTRIKNAQAVKKPSLKVPYSRNDKIIADLLVKHGYLTSVETKGRLPRRIIDISLKYDPDGEKAIRDVSFFSTPSRRIYKGYTELRPVLNGYGHAFISTSKGIMNTTKARREKVGGELLFKIW